MERMKEKRFLLLQINDALFPIGAYAHSYGLETYIQKEIVKDAETASKYIENKIEYGFMYGDLLAARLAWEMSENGDMQALARLEEYLEAAKLPSEIRTAGNKMASRFVKTVDQWEICGRNDSFREYVLLCREKTMQQPVVYGVFCNACGIEKEEALMAYLYGQTSAMVNTCVKSIPLSQTAGQQILFNAGGFLCGILERVKELPEEMLCMSAPGFDIRSMQHEHLYSRLYMS